jgi:heme-degrading monooxygenase HmoA
MKIFIEFFNNILKEQTGIEMRGHMILENVTDPTESIVLTFWETKVTCHYHLLIFLRRAKLK